MRTSLKRAVRAVLRPLWQKLSEPRKRSFEFPPAIRIASPWETLDACRACIAQKETGVYLRFGDGEINVLEGGNTIAEHGTPAFAAEMKEVFSLSGKGVLKSLPLHSKRFGLWPGMKPGVHESSDEWAETMLARTFPYFIGERIYSHVALAYVVVFDRPYALDFLSFLKSCLPIFVGNKEISPEVLDSLFSLGLRISSPSRDSYAEVDRITDETESALDRCGRSYQVVAMAMGCAGRVVAKRILGKGKYKVFFFDMGSIMDAFCGNFSRAWMENPKSYFDDLLSEIAAIPAGKDRESV